MQIVIDIDEKSYKAIVEQVKIRDYPDMETGVAIKNGTPLPKGHGRLVDIDALEKEICRFDIYHSCGSCKYMDFCTYDAPTIIGADKESKNESK